MWNCLIIQKSQFKLKLTYINDRAVFLYENDTHTLFFVAELLSFAYSIDIIFFLQK